MKETKMKLMKTALHEFFGISGNKERFISFMLLAFIVVGTVASFCAGIFDDFVFVVLFGTTVAVGVSLLVFFLFISDTAPAIPFLISSLRPSNMYGLSSVAPSVFVLSL